MSLVYGDFLGLLIVSLVVSQYRSSGRHFPLLKQNEYVICDKSDGERFLCYIDTVKGENVCALINRKSEFEHIKLRPPRECYNGTLIDGEIVIENGKRIFLVFDVVAWAGKTVSKMKLPERMKYIMDNRRKFIHSPKKRHPRPPQGI